MNTHLIKATKNDFEEYILKLMNNSVFSKTMEKVQKHNDIKLKITEKRKTYLVSQLNYHTTKFFTENLLAKGMRNTQIHINKPVYLGQSVLDLNKPVIHEFWYDCLKQRKSKTVLYRYRYMDIKKQMIFIKKLQKILKKRFILQIMN